MSAYYNEHDKHAAAWLRELIRRGLIANGVVDERSIVDVRPSDLAGFVQCHFFAGIGGWSLALRLAKWADSRPVWTGSCPCQPFSAAGKQLGTADARHLWPAFFALIRECRPEFVLGEQVASAIGKGWLDGISADLESEGYACGAVVLGAHSVGAPHIRQRLYWGGLAYAGGLRRDARLAGDGRGEEGARGEHGQVADRRCRLGDAEFTRLEGHAGHGDDRDQPRRLDPLASGSTAAASGALPATGRGFPGNTGGAWSRFDLIPCADGKTRRIEPGLAPLVAGIPARVVRLRGYGNAIVPQVAAEFIRAFEELNQFSANQNPT